MILGKYSLGRLHLNCHQIGRLEISQNNEYGVWPSWWIMCLFQHSWPWSTITQDITFIQKYETTSTWLKVDLMTGLGNYVETMNMPLSRRLHLTIVISHCRSFQIISESDSLGSFT
jgi:hypothetical protein